MDQPQKKDVVAGATLGLQTGYVNPCFTLLPDGYKKLRDNGHFYEQCRLRCCPMLHADIGRYVYNREVIPRWKERFGGASATGS
jgi:hypothetical protein